MIKAHNETHIRVFYIFISDFMILLFNYMNVLILFYMKWFKYISLMALFFILVLIAFICFTDFILCFNFKLHYA